MIELSAPGDDLYAKFKYKRKYRDKQAGDLKPAFEKEQKNMTTFLMVLALSKNIVKDCLNIIISTSMI